MTRTKENKINYREGSDLSGALPPLTNQKSRISSYFLSLSTNSAGFHQINKFQCGANFIKVEWNKAQGLKPIESIHTQEVLSNPFCYHRDYSCPHQLGCNNISPKTPALMDIPFRSFPIVIPVDLRFAEPKSGEELDLRVEIRIA